MIDIHCHILPDIDDGASDVKESLEMARQASADGIKTIFATPHTLNGVYSNPVKEIINQTVELHQAFKKAQINVNLYPGAEVHLCVEMTGKVFSGQASLLNDYRTDQPDLLSDSIIESHDSSPRKIPRSYILIEFPVQVLPHGYKDELFRLKASGITPIIAHPERNSVFQNQIEIFYELVTMGCLFQLTAMSITGGLGKGAMTCAHQMLELRLAHIIASDSHSPEKRPPILSPAVETAARIMGDVKAAEAMVTTIPDAIIQRKSVYIPEPKPMRKKKWFFGLFGG